MDENSIYALAAVVAVLFAGAAVLIPVLALSARFALKPVMETWIRLRQGETSDQEKIMQDRRIALLESELQLLQQRLEEQTFERELSGADRKSRPREIPPS